MANETLKTLNTRIAIKADTMSNWSASTVQLYNGEVALGYDSATGKYEVRIGTAEGKTWSQLAESNIVLSSKNILNLAYDSYELSNVTPDGSKDFKFQLVGRDPATQQKAAIGDPITIPEVDFTEVNAKIDYISGEVSTIVETTIPAVKTELSNVLSTYTDTQVGALETDLTGKIATAKSEAISAAAADATTKANQALADAKTYANQISSDLSSDYESKIKAIKDEIADGIHFIGHVDAINDEGGSYTIGETTTEAKNGDLVILNSAEYIWSETARKWELFGDEGNFATKKYVDDAASTAENNAIAATKNTVAIYTDKTVAEFTAGTNIGDIAINKKTITGDKKEYTAYVWNGTAWEAMDGNYSADNVFMPENMIITEKFGKYDIPSSGSKELTCAGMTIKAFINDAFAQTKSGTKSGPTFSLTVSGGTGEIGTKYTVPAATLKMTGVGLYQYGPATGITVPVNNAVIKATTSGHEQELSNSTAMALNSTISTTAGTANAETYLSGGATYTYTATANYTEGAVPKNNIGADDPGNKIPAGSFSKTASATFTGQYPAYYAFTTSPKANPTALTANNGNVTVDGVTYTRELNVFNKTSFKTTSKWYELFYLVPQAKKNNSGWKGKDSNNVDLAVEAKTTATVIFKDGTTATYNVYVVRNAAQYSATTCTMTFI